MTYELALPAFIAGLFTFLAPCTLPLVPGYLGFISGVSLRDLSDPKRSTSARWQVFLNGLLYVTGFSVVFILLGSAIGWFGAVVMAEYQDVLRIVGGAFVILFGLFMIQSAFVYYRGKNISIPFLRMFSSEARLPVSSIVKPGNPLSSFVFGAAFAVGWTPCVGPVLGAILTVAATQASVTQGSVLLGVFSLGLGLPFLILAAGFGYFSVHMNRISRILPVISLIGGIFIVGLGFLLITNSVSVWTAFFFQLFDFINYDSIYTHL